jgi:hypothetical protein
MSGVSNHYDSLVAVKAVIDGLSLSGLTGGCVIQEVAEYQDGQNTLPFVSVSPYGPEKLGDEFNDRDGVYYPVLVAIIAKPDVNSLETRLGWRQKMRRNLNNHDLGVGSGASYNATVEPGNVIEPRAYYARNAFVSGFIVRVWCQELRT